VALLSIATGNKRERVRYGIVEERDPEGVGDALVVTKPAIDDGASPLLSCTGMAGGSSLQEKTSVHLGDPNVLT
jgi:hypothetical protein